MKTTVLDGAAPLAGDHLLAARLRVLSAPLDEGRAPMRLGIQGPQGGLYRIIETTSLIEAVRLFETLHDFGLRAMGGRPVRAPAVTRVFRAQA